jgi:hypothetical protein
MSRRLITGISHSVNPENIKPGINISEEENKFLNNEKEVMPNQNDKNQIRKEIAYLAEKMSIQLPDKSAKTIKLAEHNSSDGSNSSSNDSDNSSDSEKRKKKKSKKHRKRTGKDSDDSSADSDSSGSRDSSNSDSSESHSSGSSSSSDSSSGLDSIFGKSKHKHKRKGKGKGKKSKEEVKRKHINSIFSNNSDDIFFEEKDKDLTAQMIEQIQFLKASIEAEGEDISDIVVPDSSMKQKKISSILRTLQMRTNRMRYVNLAEEGAQFVALGLGKIFNGERKFFNSFQPDLTGWDVEVGNKMRRARVNTSAVVGNFITNNNIGGGTMMIFELMLSAFAHSASRQRQRKNAEAAAVADGTSPSA